MKLYVAVCRAVPIALAAAIIGAFTAFAEDEDEDDSKAAAIASANISLSEAIAAATGKAEDTPFEAGLEEEDDNLVYEVNLADKDGKVTRIFLDPVSGEIIETLPEGLMERAYKIIVDSDDKKQLEAVRTAKVDLGRAVSLAEETSGGRAFDAGVDNEDGKVVYEVELAKNGSIETVNIDPQSGRVMQLADEEESEQDKEEHKHHK